MNRLTERNENGIAMIKGCGENCKYGFKHCRKEIWENCKTISDVIDKLADYEDNEEQKLLLKVPQIKKGKTLYWIWGNEIMPVIYKGMESCIIDKAGNPHIECKMITKNDRTFIHVYKKQKEKLIIKAGDERYFYAEELGKTIFFTKEAAKEKLAEMEV